MIFAFSLFYAFLRLSPGTKQILKTFLKYLYYFKRINDLIDQNISRNQDISITANHTIKSNIIKSIRKKFNKIYATIGSDSYSLNEKYSRHDFYIVKDF